MIDENLQLYIDESNEYLSGIESDLLEIEASGNRTDDEVINRVFRAAHTIKGGAGFFSLKNIKNLGHKIENILELIRSGEFSVTSEVINVLLLSFDKLHNLINDVMNSEHADISPDLKLLGDLLSNDSNEIDNIDLNKQIYIRDKEGKTCFSMLQFEYQEILDCNLQLYLIEIDFIEDLHNKGRGPLDLYREMKGTGTLENSDFDISQLGTLDHSIQNIPYRLLFSTMIKPGKITKLFDVSEEKILHITEVFEEDNSIEFEQTTTEIVESYQVVKSEKKDVELLSQIKTSEKVTSGTLRVKVELLEQLMELAGELVLSRNELNEAIQSRDSKRLVTSGQRVSLVTSELQEAIMMTRLQNIGSIFNSFPRLVRDVSNNLGKDVVINITGGEVELDKTIIEGLKDPLTHMVRNSLDHGVESPDERSSAGKPSQGNINLKALHEAGQVIIEISDDGRGLDLNKIVSKAVKSGIITTEYAEKMSRRQKSQLIFNPGLSTAESITDVSGRGVGMDVVKSKLDALGGSVDIDFREGLGSTFRIKLPLTLAIIPSLLVNIEDERFAIPQVNIEELINVSIKDINDKIKNIGWIDALDLRGELIPLVMLDRVLGIPKKFVDPVTGEKRIDQRNRIGDRRNKKNITKEVEENFRKLDRRSTKQSDINIVIVSNGNYKYGLVVEDFGDNLEIVVKPLGKHLKKHKEYAGATIMGDGKVALILDVVGIANMLDLHSIVREEAGEDDYESVGDELQSYLIFRCSRSEQCAIPMQLVKRIEHIEQSDLEVVGSRRVMNYRGKTLPVVALQDVANCKPLDEDLELSVIVTNIYGKECGLLAVRPIDNVDCNIEMDTETLKQTGVLGSSIINNKTTMVVDIFEIIEVLVPEMKKRFIAKKENGETPLVFIAEDSSFFRSQLESFVLKSGYRVETAIDGMDAWKRLDIMEELPSVIITDIEMPYMNGLELTRKIRSDERLKDITIFAVTSLGTDEDSENGYKAGVDEYHVKLDKAALLDSIKKYI